MSNRTDNLYIIDIRDSVEAILEYTDGITFDIFSQDRMRYSAVIREFEIIGEAAGKLSDALKSQFAEVAWQDLKDFRNILIHEYFGIDLEIVWNIISDDLPKLQDAIKKILSQ